MTTSAVVGQSIAYSIIYQDALGNPMQTTPTPDSPPVWADTTPAVQAFTPAADGESAAGKASAPGTDTVSLTLIVGGVTFSASDVLTVNAAPQVLTSIAIAAVVS